MARVWVIECVSGFLASDERATTHTHRQKSNDDRKKNRKVNWKESRKIGQIIKFYMVSSRFLLPFLLRRQNWLACSVVGVLVLASFHIRDIDATESNRHTSSSIHSTGIKQMETVSQRSSNKRKRCQTARKKKRIAKTFVCFRQHLFILFLAFVCENGGKWPPLWAPCVVSLLVLVLGHLFSQILFSPLTTGRDRNSTKNF